jgi:hypothetical protein
MKSFIKNAITLLFILFIAFAKAQSEKQEVFIIGTMHDVPKIVKHSYKPLLKLAKKYLPDAIYVERQRADDSLSLANYESSYFLPLGDSIARTFKNNPERTTLLRKMSVFDMSQDDFKYLTHYFAVNRDKANYVYYRYLLKFGVEGSKSPLRNENYDLTAPLAIAMDMNTIYAMDFQHETQLYTKLSNECYAQSQKDGQLAILIKHNKRDYRKHLLPGLFGNLGVYSNRIKTATRYQYTNRFEFRETPCIPCEEGAKVWDRRNAGMARNIGEQVIDNGHQKAVVVVGAGHLLGLKAELEKQFPQLKIRIIDQK